MKTGAHVDASNLPPCEGRLLFFPGQFVRRRMAGPIHAAVWLVVASLPVWAQSASAGKQARRPNIVLILADDLGYGDVQCYNPQRGKIPTPHLDRLAAQGMRFTGAHSSSGVCSPSRYTLLCGRYHWRTRLQSGIVGYLQGPLIAPDRLTLAGMLRRCGYHTACIGKWHLGWDWNIPPGQRHLFDPGRRRWPPVTEEHRAAWRRVFSRPIGGGPTTRGFHYYFGTDVPNWPPFCFIENDRTLGIPTQFLPRELFRDHLASQSGPAVAGWDLAQILPTLTEKACQYIRRRAATGEPFFLYLPLTSPHTPIAVAPAWRGKSGLGVPVADFIMQTDAAVGQVLQAIRDAGIERNTLVIFTSDNGFAPYVGAKRLEQQGHYPSGPLRGYKGDVWEGGHRVPFIVRWPEVVPAGSVCHHLVHQADVMATVAQIVNFRLPPQAGEDSFSFLAALRDPNRPIRPHAVFQGSRGLLAVRRGKWKLILGRGGGGYWSRYGAEPRSDLPGQLYNLENDLAEQRNLYAEHPQRVRELLRLMEQLVQQGRSTPGPRQNNDVPVRWRRFLRL